MTRPSLRYDRVVGQTFIFAADTALAGRPIFNVDDELFDYSGLLSVNVTVENYMNFINSTNIKTLNINKVSQSNAEIIMENNIKAVLRLEKLQQKAEIIKQIVEE